MKKYVNIYCNGSIGCPYDTLEVAIAQAKHCVAYGSSGHLYTLEITEEGAKKIDPPREDGWWVVEYENTGKEIVRWYRDNMLFSSKNDVREENGLFASKYKFIRYLGK